MTGAVNREVHVYPDLESLSREVAEEIIRLAQATVAERGRFTLALAGGETPQHCGVHLHPGYRQEEG